MGDLSDVEADNRDDVFAFEETVVITNKSLGLRATIPPQFRKVVTEITFTKLDYWQSRGIYSILTCKLPKQKSHSKADGDAQKSTINGKIISVCTKLRKARDDAFRKSVMAKCTKPGMKFSGAVKPRNKQLNIIAIQHHDTITVDMPAVDDATGPCSILCVCNDDRKNRYSELWVELTPAVCAYLSASVAAADGGEDPEQEPIFEERSDSDGDTAMDTDTAQEQAERVIVDHDRTPENRSSSSYGNAAQPARGQSSLHSFFVKR